MIRIRVSQKQARDFLRRTLPSPKRKYGNIKRKVEGLTFDSTGELARWQQLCLMEAAGEITDLKRQVTFVLCPPVRLAGEHRSSAVRYIADFTYRDETGALVVEDFKGFDTKESRLKRRFMKHLHGIDVVLSGPAAKMAA